MNIYKITYGHGTKDGIVIASSLENALSIAQEDRHEDYIIIGVVEMIEFSFQGIEEEE